MVYGRTDPIQCSRVFSTCIYQYCIVQCAELEEISSTYTNATRWRTDMPWEREGYTLEILFYSQWECPRNFVQHHSNKPQTSFIGRSLLVHLLLPWTSQFFIVSFWRPVFAHLVHFWLLAHVVICNVARLYISVSLSLSFFLNLSLPYFFSFFPSVSIHLLLSGSFSLFRSPPSVS